MKSRLITIIKTSLCAYILFNSSVAQSLDINMDFDGGTLGTKAESSTCEIGGEPVFTGGAGRTVFTKEESFGPGQSAEMSIKEGGTGFGAWGGIVDFTSCGGRALAKGDEIWVNFKMKFPVGFDYTTDDGYLKFLRFKTLKNGSNLSASNYEGYGDLFIATKGSSKLQKDPVTGQKYPREFSYMFAKEAVTKSYGGQSFAWNDEIGESGEVTLGQWATYELYMKVDSVAVEDGGEAIIRLWKDGVLLHEGIRNHTIDTDISVIAELYVFTYWNGGSPKEQKLFVDDFKVITSPDRPTATDANSNTFIGVDDVVKPRPPIVSISP